jgi:diguanylate cyclase (GGDEF)-like protein
LWLCLHLTGALATCIIGLSSTNELKLLLLIPVVTGAVGLICLRYRARLEARVKAVRDQLSAIRLGTETIESLAQVADAADELAILVRDVQTLLQDLRHEKRKYGELHDELRQRVANRTDALQRQIGSLRQQASRDGLTGLYNRRIMDRYLPGLVERCRKTGTDLSLLMIDVDNFKPLNDTLGHPAGDELLKNIGRIIRSTIRDQDAAFRYGGDEFAIVLPGSDAEAAQTMAKRLTTLVDGLVLTLKVSARPKLSIGQSDLSELDEPTAENLLQHADERLYDAKRASKRQPTRGAA